MITYLRMENFRLHADTVLEFDENEQVIAICGKNGSGKSTILEGILYALWGESRHGPRGLSKLVRKRDRLNGMEVEVRFTHGGNSYRVVRRRDAKASDANFYVNDIHLVKGTRQVTQAVAQVLGMDSTGFKAAVIAQQSELDNLLRLGPVPRAKTMARLLRLDAVSRAKDDSRAKYREANIGITALGSAPSAKELGAELQGLEVKLSRCQLAENKCRQQIAELEAELALTSGVDEAYHVARQNLAVREAELALQQRNLTRVETEKANLVVPELVSFDENLLKRAGLSSNPGRHEITQLVAGVEAELAKAEMASNILKQKELLQTDIAEAQARLDSLRARVDVLENKNLDKAIVAKLDEYDRIMAELQVALKKREELREEWAEVQAEHKNVSNRKKAFEVLSGVCPTCEQPIDENHKHKHVDEMTALLAELEKAREKTQEAGEETSQKAKDLEKSLEMISQSRRALEAEAEELSRLLAETGELSSRQKIWKSNLERLGDVEVDLDGIYEKRGDATLVVGMMEAVEASKVARDASDKRLMELELEGLEMRTLVDEAQESVRQAEISGDLIDAYNKRAKLDDKYKDEVSMVVELAQASSRVELELTAKRRDLEHAKGMAKKIRDLQDQGQVAEACGQLLQAVETRLNQQVRPALEGAVGDMLDKLSNGRFSLCQIDKDYNIRVKDDNNWQAVGDFSGGEQDLIALALRLGLAEVVSERSGGEGPGFLILDEVFGSQDDSRREAVMSALRSLRSMYSQVWCISHVGGLDDIADRVIEVELDLEKRVSIVS